MVVNAVCLEWLVEPCIEVDMLFGAPSVGYSGAADIMVSNDFQMSDFDCVVVLVRPDGAAMLAAELEVD